MSKFKLKFQLILVFDESKKSFLLKIPNLYFMVIYLFETAHFALQSYTHFSLERNDSDERNNTDMRMNFHEFQSRPASRRRFTTKASENR